MLALNEVGSMAVKAARGAGIPLGQAEDLGRIAIYQAGTSGNVTPITHALSEAQSDAKINWEDDRITVEAGPAALIGPIIRDGFAMGFDQAMLADLQHAPLVAAFLAESGAALCWDGCKLWRSNTSVIAPKQGPVTISDADWSVWMGFAAHTYVPQSEESRLAGAGAGLNDND